MTYVTIYKRDGNYFKIEAVGHSGYAEYGCDIVCAGISTLLQTLAISIKDLTSCECEFTQDEKLAFMSIEVKNPNDKSQLLFQSVLLGLNGIHENYKKYLIVKEKVYE